MLEQDMHLPRHSGEAPHVVAGSALAMPEGNEGRGRVASTLYHGRFDANIPSALAELSRAGRL